MCLRRPPGDRKVPGFEGRGATRRMVTTAETLFALLALLAAWRLGGRLRPALDRAEGRLDRLLARPGAPVLLPVAASALARIAVLPVYGPPGFEIHDEFSLLLQARMHLSGHLAMPPPALWPHFETFHVLTFPSYASTYFPARSAPIALGLLLGHPWLGVWAVQLAMVGAIAWALLPAVGRRGAAAGGLVAAAVTGVFGAWVNSYWGGALPALGGALVLGGYLRARAGGGLGAGLALGAGLLALMLTRPFEGFVMCLPFAAALAVTLVRQALSGRWGALAAWAGPPVLALALGVGLIAAQDRAVTGDVGYTGYELNRIQYAVAPALLTSPPIRGARGGDAVMRRFYDEWEAASHGRRDSPAGLARAAARKTVNLWSNMVGPALTVPVLLGFGLLLRARPVPALALAAAYGAFLVETWDFPHYVAGAYPLLLLAAMVGLRRIRAVRRPLDGTVLSWGLMGAVALALAVPVTLAATPENPPCGDLVPRCHHVPRSERSVMADRLAAEPGRDLVLVRFDPDDPIHEGWIWNAPDVAASDVIWARDLGPAANRTLLSRYPGRRVWRIDGTRDPVLEEVPDA